MRRESAGFVWLILPAFAVCLAMAVPAPAAMPAMGTGESVSGPGEDPTGSSGIPATGGSGASVWIGAPSPGGSDSSVSPGTPGESESSSSVDASVSAGRYMLVLESEQAEATVAAGLAEAGFAEAERIPGIHKRYGAFRMLAVTSADDETRARLLAIPGIKAVRPVYEGDRPDSPILLTDKVIVKVGSASIDSIAAEYGCFVERSIRGLSRVYVLKILDESAGDAAKVAEAIGAESGVVYSQPNRLIKLELSQAFGEIQDPYYSWQWHLNNTGQVEGAKVDADIDAPEAWEITMGEGAVIGVIDDSSQPSHEDLADNYRAGYDFLEHDGNPLPNRGPQWPDPVGQAHGIAVTGLICARANDIGVRGVAPFAEFIGCKIGLGWDYTSDEDVADAFLFAERNGAMAINNSWGGPGIRIIPDVPNSVWLIWDVLFDAIRTVATTGRGGRGVLVLFASGNSYNAISDGNVMAALPYVMAVGGTFADDSLTCYSCYGPEQSVVAPASGAWLCEYDSSMTTTDVQDTPGLVDPVSLWPIRGYNPPKWWSGFLNPITGNPILIDDPSVQDLPDFSYTRHMNGTSAACPVATGVAALAYSVDPGMTAWQARNLIEHTADKVVGIDGPFDAVTGHNPFLGHGRVNAYRAAAAAEEQWSWPSPVDNLRGDQVGDAVVFRWDLPDWDRNGTVDPDVDSVLVVQGPRGGLNWSPTDGFEYSIGQEVAPGVFVIENDLVELMLVDNIIAANVEYAVWTINGQSFYSWGRRVDLEALPVDDRPDSGLSITVLPTIAVAPATIGFAGGGIDPQGGEFLMFEWNFGDQRTATGPYVTHRYDTAGTYIVTLTAVTSTGLRLQTTSQVQILAEPNEAPTVSIRALTSTRGVAPLVVVMEAVADDPDPSGVIVSYEWEFGDGSTGTGPSVEHIYPNPGMYVVTLTVTDDMGDSRSATRLIVVQSPSGNDVSALTSEMGSALSALSACGAGAPMAMICALAVMLGAMMVRRRR